MVVGAIQPFQRNNGAYGKGIDFYSNVNSNYTSLVDACSLSINELPFEFLDSSHHLNERGLYICMDIISNVEYSMTSKAEFI
jgi:hypothetical protein